MKNIRTRFAPSPTGFLHIGGLRTALYTYLFAKQNKGSFILRIEDTDRTRLVEGAVESLIRSLEWAGLFFDEGPGKDAGHGPYIQSERLDIYQEHITTLLDNKSAYHCFCTKERLDELRSKQQAMKQQTKYDKKCLDLTQEEIQSLIEGGNPFVIRFNIAPDQNVCFKDMVHGDVSINTSQIDDQVLIKSDGFPTYHFANVVDDHTMGITHVIRGEEWISSTPKHVLLFDAFGWDAPEYGHLPLLLNKDKSKLSKRQNDVAVEDYSSQGYLEEAIINYVAMLGWNPGDDRELFTIEELIEEFDIYNVHKSAAVFDREKLDWYNAHYIRQLSIADLYDKVIPYFKNANISLDDPDYIKKILTVEQTRLKTLADITINTDYYFTNSLSYETELLVWKKADINEAKERLGQVKEFILKYNDAWELGVLEEQLKAYIENNELGVGNTLWPLRVALCGKKNSPSPFELLWILGKERCIMRIDTAIGKIA